MRRGWAVLVTLILSLGVVGVAPADAGWHRVSRGYFLALGDSLSTGYQPTTGNNPLAGYVGPVQSKLIAATGSTRVVNLACPAETAAQMIAGGGRCSYASGSQLGDAVAFLSSHSDVVKLVTVSIGYNDMWCVSKTVFDQTWCATPRMPVLRTHLDTIMQALRKAAPKATIVVINSYDPYLGYWLIDATGKQVAAQTIPFIQQVDATMAAAAAGVGAKVADLYTVFQTPATQLVSDPTYGSIPQDVAMICRYTYQCTQDDDHPTDAGYQLIADEVWRARG